MILLKKKGNRKMIEIKLRNTLIYYDGIACFDAKDKEKNIYLGFLIERFQDSDLFLVLKTEQDSHSNIDIGENDIKKIIEQNIGKIWYLSVISNYKNGILYLLGMRGEIPNEFLPRCAESIGTKK